MVTDPYLFGRIAATHALGDIYAMGRRPRPRSPSRPCRRPAPAIVEHDLFHMLRGALDVLEPAGAALVGGHSAEGAELALGFAVTGRGLLAGKLLRKGGLRPGDRLILTKPLGTGVILAADGRGAGAGKSGRGRDRGDAAIGRTGRRVSRSPTAPRACTDVTGFGLLGHLLEMLRASDADAVLDPAAIPALDGALALVARGIASSLHADNLAALAALDDAGRCASARRVADRPADRRRTARRPARRRAPRRCLDELRRLGYRAAADRPCRSCRRRRAAGASRTRLPRR